MRKQQMIFTSMIMVGFLFLAISQFVDLRLFVDGIAFIIVGFVGMVMSWTNMDIGKSIKDAIHEEGEKTRAILERIETNIGGIKTDIGGIKAKLDKAPWD